MLNFGERLITTKDFQLILFGNERIEISKSAKNKVLENYRFLQSFYKDKIIYGIIGLVVIVGMWGIVRLITNTFNIDNQNLQGIVPPCVPGTPGCY